MDKCRNKVVSQTGQMKVGGEFWKWTKDGVMSADTLGLRPYRLNDLSKY